MNVLPSPGDNNELKTQDQNLNSDQKVMMPTKESEKKEDFQLLLLDIDKDEK